MEQNLILLEAGIGTVAVLAFLVYYTRMVKRRLRSHILRNEEVKQFLKER
ncbi:MAG: hypothetical protein AABX08_04265 [Nanoarchaeota archaeon]